MSTSHQSFSLWLLQVLSLSGLLVFLLWLSLRPSLPTYDIVEFSLPVSSANTTAAQRNVSFSLEASNDNRGGIVFYDDINITLYFNDKDVGATSLWSFSQGHEKSTRMAGNVAIRGRTMVKVFRAVRNGTADMKMGLVTSVRYGIWWWRSRIHGMDMEAGVPLGKDGKVAGKGRRKKIKLHRKHESEVDYIRV